MVWKEIGGVHSSEDGVWKIKRRKDDEWLVHCEGDVMACEGSVAEAKSFVEDTMRLLAAAEREAALIREGKENPVTNDQIRQWETEEDEFERRVSEREMEEA